MHSCRVLRMLKSQVQRCFLSLMLIQQMLASKAHAAFYWA